MQSIAIFWSVIAFVEICCNPSCLQEGNVKNQREHIVHLLANEQSRVGKPSGNEPVCDCSTPFYCFCSSWFWIWLMPDFFWNSTCHLSNNLAFFFLILFLSSALFFNLYNMPLYLASSSFLKYFCWFMKFVHDQVGNFP